MNLNAQIENALNFRIQIFFRKAIVGDSPAQHAAGRFLHFENRNRMTHAPQKPGGGESRRARADNGDFMSRVRQTFGLVGFQLECVPVGDKAFDAVDVDGAVQSIAAAIRFAGMRADASADGGQRIAVFDDRQRFCKIAAIDMINIFLNVNMRRTAQNARRNTIAPMVPQERLKINFPVAVKRFRLGADDHAVCNRCGGRGDKAGLGAVGYFYKCGFEITRGADTRVISQRGNIDSVRTGGVDDRQAVDCQTVFSVNIYCNHENTSFHFLILFYPK